MRWLCFLLLASPLLMSAAAAQTSGQPRPKSLQFDIAQVPATRDSFVFRLRGEERGWAVWQYEIRRLETTQEVVYSATSEFRPVEEERLRIVVDRPKLRRRAVDHFLGRLEPADLVLPHRPPPFLPAQAKHERVARRRDLGDIELERLGAGLTGRLGGCRRHEQGASEQQETEPAHWSRESPSCAGR